MTSITEKLNSTDIKVEYTDKDMPFIDGTNADEQTLSECFKGDIPVKLDWGNKWLKGEEYSHILSHMEAYCKTFNLRKFSQKTHPESIYVQPESKD